MSLLLFAAALGTGLRVQATSFFQDWDALSLLYSTMCGTFFWPGSDCDLSFSALLLTTCCHESWLAQLASRLPLWSTVLTFLVQAACAIYHSIASRCDQWDAKRFLPSFRLTHFRYTPWQDLTTFDLLLRSMACTTSSLTSALGSKFNFIDQNSDHLKKPRKCFNGLRESLICEENGELTL